MKRLAVFVEGYTEVVFVQRLISEIAGANNVVIEHSKIRGGNKAARALSVVTAAKPVTQEKYYVLVVDCGGDALVRSRIQEEHPGLTAKGYSKIIGMRDVRPDFGYADVTRLETGLQKYIKTSLIPVEFVLTVMEIEAWFLAEFSHFTRIDPSITVDAIRVNLAFDPAKDDMALRATPTDDLDACYKIGGKEYAKANAAITVNALDFEHIYFGLQDKIPYLKKLVGHIEDFLA